MTSIKQELDQMLKRAITLCGETVKEGVDANGAKTLVKVNADSAVKEFMTTLASTCDKAGASKEMAERIIAAWEDKTGQLERSLNAARIEQIGNFIVSESTFQASFFNIIGLAPDEQPAYINDTLNETKVGIIGEDGKPERVRIVKPQERTLVGLYEIASEHVKYRTLDLYRGDVTQTALATINLARDMRIKTDRKHYDALNAAIASGGCYNVFSYEASRAVKATRVYVPHSIIDTSHLPTTNDIVNGSSASGGLTGSNSRWQVRWYDPDSTTVGLSGFRPAVLLLIEDYTNCWGDILPYGQTGSRLVATGEIIVPASDIINIARGMTLVSNTLENELQRQVQANGYMSLTFQGKNWKFIPDVTIPAGTCFPRFNLMPGLSYVKPSVDRAFVKRDDEMNYEERWNRHAMGIVIPAQNRPRGLRIKYIA